MIRNSLFSCLLLVLVAGCATSITSDISVDAEHNPKVAFGACKSYAWLGTAAILNDPEGRWEPPNFDADAEITFLIDRELRARGMVEAQVNPDVLVFYGAGIDMEGFEIKVDPATDMEQMINVPMGGLSVILIDPQSEQAILAGVATAEVKQDLDPDTVRKRLAYAVEKMFAQLPR